MSTEELSLKWGTLKSWRFEQEVTRELFKRYVTIGSSASAILQRDTPEQVDIICQIIDALDADQVYLGWEGRMVSKDEAKDYVRNYRRQEV